ncbi:MAG: NERD domain-containing protein [Paraglaciecola sp.]|nr:NERD domain-containing protein [Paraglaciecola sp.]
MSPLYLFGNFFVSGREFDALIIKENAITIIDFKNFGGILSFSENGPWYADGQEIKGGNSKNPYLQLRQNKFALLDFLKQDHIHLASRPNLGHISGLVLFHQPIEFDDKALPTSVKSWFHVTDITHALRTIDAIASSAISLSAGEIETMATAFGVNEYFPDGQPLMRSLADSDNNRLSLSLLASQQRALDKMTGWLDCDNAIFSLKGMVSTGKKSLLPFIIDAAKQRNLTPLLLAPNTRLAARYTNLGAGEFISIYQALYSKTTDGSVKNNKGLELSRYPVSLNTERLQNVLLVIVEAHLISNSYFDLDNAIYGSGHLISDLLEAFASGSPKMLIVGDPYQLSRGDLNQNLLNTPLFNEKGLSCDELLLDQQIASEPEAMRNFQFELAQSLQQQQFIALPEPDEQVVKRQGHSTKIGEDITNEARFAVYLCPTNQLASNINYAAKTKVLKHKSGYELQVNDLVDFHNSSPAILNDNDDFFNDSPVWVNAGEILRVTAVWPDIQSINIRLKGRDEDTLVRLGRFNCKSSNGQEVCLNYLPDFLNNEKPELTADQMLALGIEARRRIEEKYSDIKEQLKRLKDTQPEEYKKKQLEFNARIQREMASSTIVNAAKIRFAYAMTVHRAQGRQWSKVYIDASRSPSGITFNNDAYFRYLYTASLCAEDSIDFIKLPDLSPLVNCNFKDNPNSVLEQISITAGFMPQQCFDENLQFPLLHAFVGQAEALIPIYKTVHVRLLGAKWRVIGIAIHAYQLVCELSDGQQGRVAVRLHFDKNYLVNTISFPACADAVIQKELTSLLESKFLFTDNRLVTAINALEKRAKQQGFNLIKAKALSEWEMHLWLSKGNDALLAKAWVVKDGFISTVMVDKATTEELISNFKQLFVNDKG